MNKPTPRITPVGVLLAGVLLILALLPAAGCSWCEPDEEEVQACKYPEQFLREEWPVSRSVRAQTHQRPYRIREADQLEIIYFVSTKELKKEYRIKIRDVINILFPFHPNLNQESIEIQSTGLVQLELIGPVQVVGKTIPQVQEELIQRYAKYIRDPQLTVKLQESRQEIRDLRESITTSPRGQSRLVPVTPDGTIALPLIGVVRAGGRTIDELTKVVNEEYFKLGLDQLSTTVNLQTIAPLRVYVMGEVRNPGLVLNATGTTSGLTHLTLLQALAQAGGYFPARAQLSKVLLIRSRNVPYPQSAVINVRQLLANQTQYTGRHITPDQSKFRHDIWLEDGDVIYVPTNSVANRADYIEYAWTRGFYGVMPLSYTINATYAASDVVDWLGPNP